MKGRSLSYVQMVIGGSEAVGVQFTEVGSRTQIIPGYSKRSSSLFRWFPAILLQYRSPGYSDGVNIFVPFSYLFFSLVALCMLEDNLVREVFGFRSK